MLIKILNGNSGCDVFLCEEFRKKYVRKVSPSTSYNQRLENQMRKQASFFKSFDEIRTPAILRSGYKGDLFYFDMEYIDGNSMSDKVNKEDIRSLDPYLNTILKYLSSQEYSKTKDLTGHISKKVEGARSIMPQYSNYFDYILDYSWDKIPFNGFCHGDFTFENLIILNKQVFFIDFLDTFVESVLLDISKLLFDVRYFWSKRDSKRKTIIKNIYIDNLIVKTDLYRENYETINRLLVLDILRVIPYCKDKYLLDYLQDCLCHARRQ